MGTHFVAHVGEDDQRQQAEVGHGVSTPGKPSRSPHTTAGQQAATVVQMQDQPQVAATQDNLCGGVWEYVYSIGGTLAAAAAMVVVDVELYARVSA